MDLLQTETNDNTMLNPGEYAELQESLLFKTILEEVTGNTRRLYHACMDDKNHRDNSHKIKLYDKNSHKIKNRMA